MQIETLVPTRMEPARCETVQRATYTGTMQVKSCAIASTVPPQPSRNAALKKAIATPTPAHEAMCTDRMRLHWIAIAPAFCVWMRIEIYVAMLLLLAIRTKLHMDMC
jgi:hypothetical protein